MSQQRIIAISPSDHVPDESSKINSLFEAGLFRYHIHKTPASEQLIAEILEGLEPKYLGQITLHSHFHLVLAYGVGGIHYSAEHRNGLYADYLEKVKLYQGFGVKVSTEIYTMEDQWEPANYALLFPPDSDAQTDVFQVIDTNTPAPSNLFLAFQLSSKFTHQQCLKSLVSKL